MEYQNEQELKEIKSVLVKLSQSAGPSGFAHSYVYSHLAERIDKVIALEVDARPRWTREASDPLVAGLALPPSEEE